MEEETCKKLEILQMTTGRIEARLLKLLARLVSAKRILEISTFARYSALSMKAIHQFNERVIQDGRVELVLLTVRDGLNCIIKN